MYLLRIIYKINYFYEVKKLGTYSMVTTIYFIVGLISF